MTIRIDPRRVVLLAARALLLAVLTSLAGPRAAAAEAYKLDPYRGGGAWIDIYDGSMLWNPLAVVDQLASSGTRTLYLETANYRLPGSASIAYPVATSTLVDAAHATGIRVVAWYLPSFKNEQRDLRRSLDAIRFTTTAGDHFDSFALDIEANVVRSIPLRNRRLLRLSRRIRAAVGMHYELGAIVPDQRSTSTSLPSLWPRFPYRRLGPIYNVFLPMSYSSFRGKGARFVYAYTRANAAYLRLATGQPALPVHVIGGLASKLGAREDEAVIRAARDEGAIGASFYKLSLSSTGELQALGTLK